MREVVCRHVFDEGAHELVIADAPVDPAQEENELHERRERERPGVRFKVFEHLGSVGFSLRRRLMGALVRENEERGRTRSSHLWRRMVKEKKNAVVIGAKNVRLRRVLTLAQAEAYATEKHRCATCNGLALGEESELICLVET